MMNCVRNVIVHSELARDIYAVLKTSGHAMTAKQILESLRANLSKVGLPTPHYTVLDLSPVIVGQILNDCVGVYLEPYGIPESPFYKVCDSHFEKAHIKFLDGHLEGTSGWYSVSMPALYALKENVNKWRN